MPIGYLHKIRISAISPMRLALRMVWRNAPGWTLLNLSLECIEGLLPVVMLKLLQRIIDMVAVSLQTRTGSPQEAAILILLIGATAVAMAVFRAIADYASEAQALQISAAVLDELHSKSVEVDLSYYENAAYHDALHRAQKEAPHRPARIVASIYSVFRSAVSLAGIYLILISMNWLIAVALAAMAIPGALWRVSFVKSLNAFETSQLETDRKAWYHHWMITGPEHAKEIRLFGLGQLFVKRFNELHKSLREGRLTLSLRRARADIASQILVALGFTAAFSVIVSQTYSGAISLGSLVMYYQCLQGGLVFLQSILRGFANLYEDNLYLAEYHRFLSLKSQISRPENPRPCPSPLRIGVRFEGVTFSYPNSSHPAIDGIDFSVSPGETVAVVGPNGSGKTTLVKLLCRLYDPQKGSISADGNDLRSMDPVAWRRNLGVISQDFARYHLSAGENIWIGDIDRHLEVTELWAAARQAGTEPILRDLPSGMDTILGTWFQGGRDLSTGEWQKIALSRVFYRNAGILVLDEPTSALDSAAEADLFMEFRRFAAGKSILLISHRFSTVRLADRIYVMQQGRISECGSHQELLRRNGLYARLYRIQAQNYAPRE